MKYDKIFSGWLAEGIIEVFPGDEINNIGHYLPHRSVVKTHGTTKIRPVFDASASKKGSPSLNQCLEKGPNLIELVPTSINRFREGEIGVVSDIKKAFLQISIDKKDRDFLRFLWVKKGKIITFRHCRVVFGLSCSPFLLAAIIKLHLSSILDKIKGGKLQKYSQEIVEKLKGSFYVDNCVTSLNSKVEVSRFILESTEIFAAGGFDLRGWEYSGDASKNYSSLALGILWDKNLDTLSINPDALIYEIPKIVTKRNILSAAQKVFDPIGFTCPTSLTPKILLKKLWSKKINWDEKVEDDVHEEFLRWISDLSLLTQIKMPRKLGRGDLTLHTFCDASGSAYAAVTFARVEYEGTVTISLLNAKSRIAPENASIPRLELLAACIGARLAKVTAESLTRKISRFFYWSDSTTVLAWISRDIQWGTFVFNRVKEIRSLTENSDWQFVPGNLNPADLPSRGCSPRELLSSKWWMGPDWLYNPESNWPKTQKVYEEDEVMKEVKKSAVANFLTLENSHFKISDYFSSYSKLIRFLAYVQRFLKNRREILKHGKSAFLSSLPKERKSLSFKELKIAETKFLKYLQEIMFLKQSASPLSSLKVVLNSDGLRVLKTKIFYRYDDHSFLCPIVLDGKHEIVRLLVRETHELMGHAGIQLLMSHLREKFWIISLRKLAKAVISDCIICKKQAVKHMECEIPPLPENRVRNAAIFEIVGVDFAGPVFLQGGGKGWICIFTCAVYRAVHLELASGLSTESFLECLRRFIARRGRPRLIYSDNGTNFTGTANAFNKLDWDKIVKHSSAIQIEWLFNPPSAPWWGGWWERLIGILKTILRKILGKASLSYESMVTTLCDAEAIINARPLTYVSDDPDDLKPLSPSLFLQELREVGVPDCDMLSKSKLDKKLKYRQKLMEDLRKRFRNEYLGQLLIRGNKKELRKLKIGNIVLIGDDGHKRIDWPLARIEKFIKGRDGYDRIVILKTKNGLLKRPIQRVYPLCDNNLDSHKVLCDKVKNVKIKTN